MPQEEKSWEKWKDSLSLVVNLGEKLGFEERTMNGIALRLGNWLADHVDPLNREQRVLKELWDVADEEERQVLAALVTRMVSDGRRQEDMVH
ncbi:DUF3243 domain-containing protein [Moorella sp. Hama-1]|uniref:DUF3243 domain-containing protein n=1 Tax=Moorella sp. Hama-1 TaxID=2138101 RepID=UPI000D6453AB|nr:DUF3243 domain-containing protein [Moorella sp. Hama-1]MDN5361344.1 hypothetical protein [Moorella sp. (in: firmicutes)]BCV22118.1 hypothetical protein hamaS1_21870 [Moorella sp. Hama-1]